MSENAQVSAAQNPAENPSKAVDSDPNLGSYFDAWNHIQYILYLVSGVQQTDAIQHQLDFITNICTNGSVTLTFWQLFEGFTPSDAAKRIASIAEKLSVDPFPDAAPADYFQSTFGWILDACKAIDPSSVS
jgi:hypothetical protein